MSLQQVLAILWARKWVAILTLTAAVAAASAIILILPPRYEASTSVMLDIAEPDPVTGKMMPSQMIRTHQRTQLALLESDRVALEVIRRLDLTRDPEYQQAFKEATTDTGGDLSHWIAEQLRKNLTSGFIAGSNVMEIGYQATSAQVAAVMANTFKAAYLTANLDVKVEPARRNAEWFATQIDSLREDHAEARAALNEFQDKNEILVQGEGSDLEGSKLMALNATLLDARAALNAAESRLPPPGVETEADALRDPVVTSLKTSLAQLDAQASTLRSQVGPNNPKLQAVYAQRTATEARIKEAIQEARQERVTRVAALRAQVSDLESQIADQRQRMLSQRGGLDTLGRLSQAAAFRQRQVDEAEMRAATYRMQGQQSFVNAVSLDEAAPPANPAFPQKPLIFALAIGLGGGAGIVLSLLVEMFDRRIRTTPDLADAVGIQPLGSLASARGPRRLGWRRGRGESSVQAVT